MARPLTDREDQRRHSIAPADEPVQEPPLPARVRRLVLRLDPPSVVLALVLGTFTVVGVSFNATDTAEWFASSRGAVVGGALTALGIALVLYIPIRLIYGWLDRQWERREGEAGATVMSMRSALRRWLWPTFGPIAAAWLTWLLVHYPGSLDSDTVTQMLQWLGLVERTDHHPWFDTAIFGWFWGIGAAVNDYNVGLFVFLLFQVTATALGMALALVYLSRLGLPDVWRWVLTGFVAVFPTFAPAVSVMSKDSFAAIFWLPFYVLFVEAVRTRGRVLARPWVATAAIAIIIPLVLAKRTNGYLLVLCAIVLLVLARGVRLRILAGTGVILAVTHVVWPLAVLPALGVKPGTLTDMVSIPVQQTARTVATHGSDIPASERDAIDAVLGYEGLAEAYVPRRSDAVKARWDSDATGEQVLAYVRVWLAQLARYPGTYLSATANNTFEYVAPVSPVSFQDDLDLPERYINNWHAKTVEGTPREQIESLAASFRSAPALDNVRGTVNQLTDATTNNLLASKAFYCSWIPLFALVFAIRRRSWLHVLATFPLFVNLAFLVAGPVALPRYMYPMILGSVLVVGLMLVPVRWQKAQ